MPWKTMYLYTSARSLDYKSLSIYGSRQLKLLEHKLFLYQLSTYGHRQSRAYILEGKYGFSDIVKCM